jgi:CcmD family protein
VSSIFAPTSTSFIVRLKIDNWSNMMVKRFVLIAPFALVYALLFLTPAATLRAQSAAPKAAQPAAPAQGSPQAPSAGQKSFDEYVPIGELPPTEKMPAAPYVIAAYALVWIIAMFYIWTIWRRVGKLESEFRALERRSRKETSR